MQAFQKKFLQEGGANSPKKQIINIGCGYDTTIFNLLDQIKSGQENSLNFKYIEMDLPEVVVKKIKFINKSNKIKQTFAQADQKLEITDSGITSQNYALFSGDITDLEDFRSKLQNLSIDFS